MAGHAVVLEPGKGSWALETEPGAVMDGDRVEHIIEAARVLGRYADALGVRSFPRGNDWSVARRDAVVRDFAQLLREAGDQPRIGAAASLPGARRRDDAAREAGGDRREAVRSDLGLAPEGAADRRARQRGPRRGPARHGDRRSPGPRDTSSIPRTRRSSARSPSRRAESSCTSSTIPTTRSSAPTRST